MIDECIYFIRFLIYFFGPLFIMLFQHDCFHFHFHFRFRFHFHCLKDLTKGDPALVYVDKKRYSLTTQPYGSAGVDVANALHILAHREGICRCNRYVPC